MAKSISLQKGSGKGFFGDFLGSISSGIGGILGSTLGPVGGILGSGLGSALSPVFKRIPFKKGGVVHMMPDGTLMKGKVHKAKKGPAKGSKAMKNKMAKLRAMRK